MIGFLSGLYAYSVHQIQDYVPIFESGVSLLLCQCTIATLSKLVMRFTQEEEVYGHASHSTKNCCVLTTGKMIWKSIICIEFLIFCQVIGLKKIVGIQITIRDFDDQLFGDGDFSKADQVRISNTKIQTSKYFTPTFMISRIL